MALQRARAEPSVGRRKFDYAPVKSMIVPDEELSAYTLDVKKKFDCGKGCQKLVPYLGRHEKVVHHIALLKFWERLGVRIEAVHSRRRG